MSTLDRKKVTADVTVRLVVEVPADWDDFDIAFWLTGSSLCKGSYIAAKLVDGGCGCEKVMGVQVVCNDEASRLETP